MRWICFFLIYFLLSCGVSAQDQKSAKEIKKEASQRKKDERNAKIDTQYRQTDPLVTGRKFVLEAHFLKISNGERFGVPGTLNFISVDSLSAIIQVGSYQRVGYNGVGGFTVQGRIYNWKLQKDDKRKNFYLTFTIQGNIDIYDVSMNIDYEGYAEALLNGINSGKLTFEGNLVSREGTSVFKGQTR